MLVDASLNYLLRMRSIRKRTYYQSAAFNMYRNTPKGIL